MREGARRSARAFALAALLGALAPRAVAGRVLDETPFRALDAPLAAGASITLAPFALDDGTDAVLEVARLEPFARDAQIVVHGPEGDVLAPLPSDRWFTGRVSGDAESFVMLARGRSLRGFISTKGRVTTIGPERNPYGGGPQGRTLVGSFDPATDAPDEARWFTCGEEGIAAPPESLTPARAGRRALSNVMYYAGVAIETDYELFVKKGSSAAALAQYVGDLFAAISAVYQRDVLVTLQVNYLSVWTTASDPWAAADSAGGLYEFGDYWHANHGGVPRSTAHFLSGRATGGGIAWISVLCRSDFLCSSGNCGSAAANGHYGGGYGFTGSLSGASPANFTTTYWDFFAVSHEIGHNFSSKHTHCYSPPVDQCYSGESGCYSGTTSVPAVKGTIMSYCHLLSGGNGNIKMFLGVPGEPSAAVTTQVRTYVEGKAACFGAAAGPTVAGIVPPSGPTVGGTAVTLSGTGFAAPAAVTIRGAAATSVTVVNATTLTAVTPAGVAGLADVSVLVGTQGATLAGGYTYSSAGVPPPPPPVSAAAAFVAVTPCRLLDTRSASGPLGGPGIGAGGVRSFVATGTCNVVGGALAISANVTVVAPAATGDLVAYPNGIASPPGNSTLSFRTGRTRANNTLVYLASDGSFLVRNNAAGTLDLVVDVNGYFK